MKPVDHVNPMVPANWVRRVEEKRRRSDPKQRNPGKDQQTGDQKHPPGQDPDGRTHIIDELA
jgi:hypothetical protein